MPDESIITAIRYSSLCFHRYSFIVSAIHSSSLCRHPCKMRRGFRIARSIFGIPAPHAPGLASSALVGSIATFSRPPGHGYGLDSLDPADLSAIFTHGGSPVAHDNTPIPFSVLHGNIFPAASRCHEKACIDNSTDKPTFMKLYEVGERSSRGKGTVKIHVTSKPNDNSPSQPIYDDPTKGVQLVLDAVFRSQVSSGDSSMLFTSWVACPPFGPEGMVLCYTSGHSFASENYGLTYTEDVDLGWQAGTGHFGSLVRQKQLWTAGFDIATKPLAIAYDTTEDFACFVALCSDADFLLPCSPDEVKLGGFVASFGYPCVQYFLQQAHEELILKSENNGMRNSYQYLTIDGEELYKSLKDTFGSFMEGQLLCSPGVFTSKENNILYIKSSTLIGASGSPIIPTNLLGYTIGIHEGGTCTDANVAVSTDSPGFVRSFAKHVLPRLPGPSHPVFGCRDLGPFQRWLRKHNLRWNDFVDAKECFCTPRAKA